MCSEMDFTPEKSHQEKEAAHMDWRLLSLGIIQTYVAMSQSVIGQQSTEEPLETTKAGIDRL